MARPTKIGLDYFPMDTDFFDDDKIQFLSARFGLKGESICTRLMCKIYRDRGYYLTWDDDTALLFAKRAGDGVTLAFVNDVVDELLKRGFFDEPIFKSFSVLTSRGIQRRYVRACTDSNRSELDIKPEWDLIGFNGKETTFPPEKTGLTGEENTQRKGKETKGEESKQGTARDTVSSPVNGRVTEKDFEEIWKLYPNSQGKKNARRHFFASVKTAADMERIKKALDNYQLSKNFKKGFIKNGSTWFNEWQDWENPKPAMMEDPAANQPSGPGFIDFKQQRKEAERKRFLGEQ
jgi:hypothetical protein